MKARPWLYMGILVGLIALLAVLSILWPSFYDAFVGPYLWEPILYDEGFNPVNTVAFVAFLGLAVLWFYHLFLQYDLRLDVPTELAGLAWIAWGSSLRVLEDADLFAPFAGELAEAGLPAQTSCAPGLTDGVATSCAGALFITPIIWIWPALLLFVAGRTGLAVQQADARHGRQAGLALFVLGHLVGLMGLLLLRGGQWVRFWPPVWLWVLAAAASVAWLAWRGRREGHLRWSWALLAYAFPLWATSGHAMWVWWGPGADGWSGGGAPIVLLLFVLGPAALIGAVWWHARALSRGKGREGGAVGLLVYVVVIEAFAIVGSLIAIAQGTSWWWVGPVTVLVGHWAVRRASWRMGHPGVAALALAFPLLMVGGQAADAFATTLGIDVYGAGEKHVLPAGLIRLVDALPSPLGDHPAAVVMVLYKITLTLVAAWYIETRALPLWSHRQDLIRVIQLTVANVGFAPGLRNALRLAMGV